MNKHSFNIKKLIKSFTHATNGVIFLLTNEQNARVHAIITIFVAISGYVFQVSRIEAAILFMAIVLVFAVEIINTAIENIFDLFHPENHDLIQAVKDAMAGAVLISATIAFVVAVLIFLPYIKDIFVG